MKYALTPGSRRKFLPKPLIYLVLASLAIWLPGSCEKDDICVDGDTPLMIVRFYDADNPTEVKDVPALRVVGLGQQFTVNTIQDRTSLDSIGLPLHIHEPTTTFLLIENSATSDDMETGNIDTLTFNYETKEVFVSRACGFVARYDGLGATLTTGDGNWIRGIEIVRPFVQLQDSAHVKIFH